MVAVANKTKQNTVEQKSAQLTLQRDTTAAEVFAITKPRANPTPTPSVLISS